MGFFKSLFRGKGSVGTEFTVGNQRFDSNSGQGPNTYMGDGAGNMRTVMRPDGKVAQEWTVGNMRYSSDKNGFDTFL